MLGHNLSPARDTKLTLSGGNSRRQCACYLEQQDGCSHFEITVRDVCPFLDLREAGHWQQVGARSFDQAQEGETCWLIPTG